MSRLALIIVAVAVCLWIPGGGRSAAVESSAPMQITVVDTVTAQTSGGLQGTFTASGLVCPAGTFTETETGFAGSAVHTCADGSGTFDSSHRSAVGADKWTLNGGTDRYVTLRGGGPCELQTLADGTRVRTCHQLAAFDNVAPSASITRLTVSAAPHKRFTVRASFAAADDVAGNPVTFKVVLAVGSRALAIKRGTTTGGRRSFVVRIKAPAAARKLTMTVAVADPVGNAHTIRRVARIPRR
ncbi:MAG: hypothetical protein QOG06_7 [Gaiellaceae bacterium]|jgi:hypothetical protein|nr:hypothetical protein [Gaiellaceae bacterium]